MGWREYGVWKLLYSNRGGGGNETFSQSVLGLRKLFRYGLCKSILRHPRVLSFQNFSNHGGLCMMLFGSLDGHEIAPLSPTHTLPLPQKQSPLNLCTHVKMHEMEKLLWGKKKDHKLMLQTPTDSILIVITNYTHGNINLNWLPLFSTQKHQQICFASPQLITDWDGNLHLLSCMDKFNPRFAQSLNHLWKIIRFNWVQSAIHVYKLDIFYLSHNDIN